MFWKLKSPSYFFFFFFFYLIRSVKSYIFLHFFSMVCCLHIFCGLFDCVATAYVLVTLFTFHLKRTTVKFYRPVFSFLLFTTSFHVFIRCCMSSVNYFKLNSSLICTRRINQTKKNYDLAELFNWSRILTTTMSHGNNRCTNTHTHTHGQIDSWFRLPYLKIKHMMNGFKCALCMIRTFIYTLSPVVFFPVSPILYYVMCVTACAAAG